MEIRINGKLAALKKGTSFEYVAENRMFSDSDGYTLSITFPLRQCQNNIEIFGHINRMDVLAGNVIFDCEIRDRNFYKSGSITITEIDDTEVKTQFLEGRSEQNFDKTFDDIFINELDLGSAQGCVDSSPADAWNPVLQQMKCVALPWVNEASGNIQNLADFHPEVRNDDGSIITQAFYSWNEECKGRSWQPYLLYIAKRICEAVGYSYDFSKWEQDEQLKYLLVCNTLPYAWNMDNFSAALPHWTVAEFFEKLELLLDGEFDIDHKDNSVKFDFVADALNDANAVLLENIVEEHSTEVSVEKEDCDYSETKNLVYKECSHEMWKFYSCDWFIKAWKSRLVKFATVAEMLNKVSISTVVNGAYPRGSYYEKLLYAADVDAYFIIRAIDKTLIEQRPGSQPNRYRYRMELRPLNLFGGRIVDDTEDADSIEIEFVPAWVDQTDDERGRLLFLSFSGYDDNTSVASSLETDLEKRKEQIDNTLFQPFPLQALEAGEKTKKSEFYNLIYIAWWNGASDLRGRLPHPFAEDIEISSNGKQYRKLGFSLRLNDKRIARSKIYHTIETKQKTNFRFISDTIPNPRAVYFIRGKRYICEKLTATFTENGISQLIKGVFYPIKE